MRRLTLMMTLLTVLCLLTGCTPQPDLIGRWETSLEETQCATLLYLNSDGSFWHMQEGMQLEGTWVLRDNALTLTGNAGGAFTCTLDRENGRLIMGEGLHLYRQSDPDITGYWMTFSEDTSGHVSLFLMPSGLFKQEIYAEDLPPNTLDGGEYLTGRWSLGGLVLTLHGDDRTVLTHRLSPDYTTIDLGNGVLLKNYTAE